MLFEYTTNIHDNKDRHKAKKPGFVPAVCVQCGEGSSWGCTVGWHWNLIWLDHRTLSDEAPPPECDPCFLEFLPPAVASCAERSAHPDRPLCNRDGALKFNDELSELCCDERSLSLLWCPYWLPHYQGLQPLHRDPWRSCNRTLPRCQDPGDVDERWF